MEKEMIDILQTDTVYFGHQGENIAREVIFDITSLKREFPDAVYSLVLKRNGENETFTAAAATIEGNEFRYQPTSWATMIAGEGQWEIHAIDGTTGLIAKTMTGKFQVDEALDVALDAAPEVAENWVAEVTQARDEAVEAARLATEAVAVDLTEIQEALAQKMDMPLSPGAPDQMLVSDGEGGQWWVDQPEPYELPRASRRQVGGVILGDGIELDGEGKLTVPSVLPATHTTAGLMSALDKIKLDNLQNYDLPPASENALGGVKVGDNLSVDQDGTLNAQFPIASEYEVGGVKPGNNVSVGLDGTLDVNIPVAGPNQLGGVKVGANLSVAQDGTLNAQNSYELPPATNVRLGGVIVGDNLSVDQNGRLSADAQAIQPATEETLGGIIIGNGLVMDETGVASAYTYDISKTQKEDQTYQLNLIRSDGNSEEIIRSIDLPQGGGGGGGGGSASGYYLDIERVTTSPIIVTTNDTVEITVDIQSRESSDPNADFVDGSYVWKIGTTILQGMTGPYSRVRNTFDLTPFMTAGTQKVSLTVTQADSEQWVTKTWTVQMVDVRIETSFRDDLTYPANEPVSFGYTPYGAVPKVVHFKLDGVELPTVSLDKTVSGIPQACSIAAHAHGTHSLEVWMVATVGVNEVPSNHIYKDIIWYDEEAETPIISCAQKAVRVPASMSFEQGQKYYVKQNELFVASDVTAGTWDAAVANGLYYMGNAAKQYSSTTIVFSVYDPTDQTPDVIMYEDGVQIGTRTLEESTDRWVYKSDSPGVHTLKIQCKTAFVELIMDIESLGVVIHPVTDNLVFDFNPTGRSNSDANRNWSYTNANNATYRMTVSEGFDWVNGGYQQDENGDVGFLVKAGNRAIIDWTMFGRDSGQTKLNGQHFKVVFRTENVRNASATWLSCMGEGGESEAGIQMNVHEAYLYSGNASVNSDKPTRLYSPYSEEDRIEYEYDILPIDISNIAAESYIMSYEDGTMFRPIIYDNQNILQQLPASPITIGSDDCDVWIYRMKAYSVSLTDEGVINNFIADASSGEEMYSRYVRNQIYDGNKQLTPETLAQACPDLRIIKISAPHFTNKKDNTVEDTTVQCIYGKGDPALDNWTVTHCSHSGQGTTSDGYGVSGRNIDVKFNTETSVVTFGDGTQSAPGKVKISLTRNSVPVNYFNIKVNIASSENANNALLAKRYDRYLPYRTPASKRDSKVKTTMEFFNCVVFVQETGDQAVHEEFKDTNWHFYAIGNIGDSKKTDKTRVYTPDDPKEFVNEILDNTKPNSRFDTGVYNLLVSVLPASGELFTDYYTQNGNGTFTLSRYLDGDWVTVKNNVAEITNGAVALLGAFPTKGITGIEYYVPDGSGYQMRIWINNAWSNSSAQTSNDFGDAMKRHMATAIDPRQWIPGNEKYDAMLADPFKKSTWEMRYEASEKLLSDSTEKALQHAANLQVWYDMYTWMVTSTDQQFVNELDQWFYKDAALYAYLFTEQYTMMDNRAKNTFWHWARFYVSTQEYETLDICYTKVENNTVFDGNTSYYIKENDVWTVWNGGKNEWNSRPQLYVHNNCYIVDDRMAAHHGGYRFDFWDYDNDSSIGIDNTGALGLSYGKEDIDNTVEGDPTSKSVYNATDSVFFRRIRLLMHEDLRSMYQTLENSGCWAPEGFINEFDTWQNQWPEALWSKDMERKYIRPYFGTSIDNSTTESADKKTVKKSSVYLTDMLNGRKRYQRRQWIRDQYVYMGTKYLSSSIRNNSILLRCYEPKGAAVSPNYTLHIVPFTDMYLSVHFGSGDDLVQIRAKAGTMYDVPCPISMSGATDIPFYIYAAGNIQELSDLSACYFTTNDFAGAVKLRYLKVGNSTPGYSNQITVLNLGSGRHDLLDTLDVTNCTNLVGTTDGGTMNLAGCGRLREFYAGGTAISSVVFATNGPLETAVLPDSLTGLTMIGLNKLKSFTANYDHLMSLTVQDSAIDTRAIIGEAYDTIRTLKLVDVDWRGDQSLPDTTILNALSDMERMYSSEISGYINIAGRVAQRELDHYEEVWHGFLKVGYEDILPQYRVDYYNGNNQLLAYEYVNAGSLLTDPVGRKLYSPQDTIITMLAPTMEKSDRYEYVFTGNWDTLEGPVTRARSVTALYTSVTRKYTVNWYPKIGGTKLATGEYEYGTEAVYDYTPTKDSVKNSMKTYYYRPFNSFVEYTGEWNSRPQLYEHNEIPTDISGEGMEIFRLFAGWDKNTGYVRPDHNNADGHLDVYAVWEECEGIPEVGSNTSEMTASEIYAIARQGSAAVKQRFDMENLDYVKVDLGFDPEFTNVDSETLIDHTRYFDGTAGEIVLDRNGHELHLFAEDAPTFVMAIDFEMRNGGSSDNEKTLLGCYSIDGRRGFRLKCGHRDGDNSYRPVIEWGNQTFDVSFSFEYGPGDAYFDARYRDMVVIRHIAGDPVLYVYTSNVTQYFSLADVTRYQKTRPNYEATDAPLVFGGNYIETDQEFNNNQYGSGYIHWCKIWYDDLGETNCCRIASWPRETLNMEYYGTLRYYMAEGGRSNASFISRKPLYGRSVQQNSEYTEDALWSNSPARMFLARRLFNVLPVQWQSMIRTVRLKTVLGSDPSDDIETTEDKLYLPGYAEVYPITESPFIQEQFENGSAEGSMITWFSSFAYRAKSKVVNIRRNPKVWTGMNDPTTIAGSDAQLGDVWVQQATGGYPVYIFVDTVTIERDHLVIKTGTMMNALGGWVQCATMWGLRTPNSEYLNNNKQYLYYVVTQYGGVQTSSFVASSIHGGDGISIVPCFSI